ncbi:O-acetyl-ADP-ribose deacetylase [Christensenellaceae bacterium OttesenSCG-928-K19]|nr:O-acetyl-ADP-ribose deacetylase [Christensenellaceae bacterium OttesenSCG-928-K19]
MKQIRILLADITKIKVDAIVNAANTSLLGGGGVDGAIHRAAGPELLKECTALGGCETGQAKITKGYNLPASYVIHTPGPVWRGGSRNEEALLEGSYLNSLKLAEEYGCKTVAFPSISTGIYHFPLDKASTIALRTIDGFLQNSSIIEVVTVACFDEHTKQAYEQAAQSLNMHVPVEITD